MGGVCGARGRGGGGGEARCRRLTAFGFGRGASSLLVHHPEVISDLLVCFDGPRLWPARSSSLWCGLVGCMWNESMVTSFSQLER